MTETPVEKKKDVRIGPFLIALILAPISVGLPAFALVWLAASTNLPIGGIAILLVFPAVATVVGAPTYLLFGGPAFWFALRRDQAPPIAGFVANLISLPFVVAYFSLVENANEMGAVIGFYGGLGSIFALIWGAIFAAIYNRLAGDV